MARILCVDDTPTELLFLEKVLQAADHEVTTAPHVPAALEFLEQEPFDLVISDYRMPKLTGLELLNILARDGYDVPLIMSTAYGTIEDAVASIKAGAIDYITKPVRREQLELAVSQALELTRLRRENAKLREEVAQYRSGREVVGESPSFQRVMRVIETVATTNATVLVQGESGTGKELLARALHELSDRPDQPFVAINCAAMPETLIESMLFGHEKGAFTGADKRVEGAFERANGGTLLLDEISEMRLDLQAKLLRVLQEKEFERLGGSKPIRIDVRVVATTNRDLEAAVAADEFRRDLFYRINVVPIRVPPLRDRRDDIPLLAQRFVDRAVAQHDVEPVRLTERALQTLRERDWPGNVRELQHVVERAVILTKGPEIDSGAFVDFEPTNGTDGQPVGKAPRVILHSFSLGEAEKILIDEALAWTEGNRTRASQLLGISDRTLRNKLNN
ncbi:MAG: sigma-54 dependent transcriptional regulator [Gemmatimonadetes bacterium]|nr:sigma-54 dependent transcriptional regulator [Gemmatimonadota bacterium]